MTATTTQTAFRIPNEMLERVDAYAARMGSKLHITITRTDAFLMLLQSGLHHADVATPKQPMLPNVNVKPKPPKKTNVKR